MPEKPMGERVATLEVEMEITREALTELLAEVKALRANQDGWRGSMTGILSIVQTICIPAGFLYIAHVLGK
jgi:hypothetical protein